MAESVRGMVGVGEDIIDGKELPDLGTEFRQENIVDMISREVMEGG